MKFEGILLSESSQRKTKTICSHCMKNLTKTLGSKTNKQKNMLMDTENRFVTVRGGRVGVRGVENG